MKMLLSLETSLIKDLRSFLLDEQILAEDVDLRLYDTDATALFKSKPEMVLLPNNVQEVSKIIKVINNHNKQSGNKKLGFVARGAGTGLSGGAIAGENEIIISLARLNKVLEVDTLNQAALIETGVVNASLSEQIKNTGLHFAPDPSSQKSCTIGGNIAENAGGIHCLKYGVTSQQVLGLEVVMPDGEIVYLGSLAPNSDKPHASHNNKIKSYKLSPRSKSDKIDLAKLFTGSEGTFGIATKALVKLNKLAESFLTMQVSFTCVKQAAELVAAIVSAGFCPAALEMIDTNTIRAVDKAFDLNISKEVNAILLIEVDGDSDEVIWESKQIKELVSKFNPLKYEETQDLAKRNMLWKVRKGSAAAFGQIAPYWYLYDLVVPRSKIPEALSKIEAISSKHKLMLANICHAGDGNLHPNFLYDPDKDPTVVERIHKASSEIMTVCIELGGALSGEHGIGIEKKEYMDYLFSKEDMDTMMKVRKVFDKDLISNKNKLFPIKICKEAFPTHDLNDGFLAEEECC